MSDQEGLFGRAVTAVRAVKSDPSRVSVLVDGQRVARLRAEDAVRLGVRVGQAWTPELAERARVAEGEGEALRAALRLVGPRARTRRDVLDRLARRGHAPEAARAAVERLEAQGLIDDAAAGAAAAEAMLARQPAGPAAVEARLRKIGIAGEAAREAAREALRGRDERADAVAVARKHARALPPGLAPEAARRRLLGRLARRGFGAEVAREVVEEVMKEEETERRRDGETE